jgi:hydroxylamine dehydrogenase
METNRNGMRSARVLVIGLVVVLVVLGLALVILLIGRAGTDESGRPVDALAASTDECVTCHRRSTPGIVDQYGHSTMAAAEVACRDCHEVAADYPGAVEHEGTYVLRSPTTASCQPCHQTEVAQYNNSRHGLPAYVAVFGTEDLSDDLMSLYESIPEGQYQPAKARNVIGAMEGPEITRFACEVCHNIGRPAADGSVGQCQKCHLRHEFSLEQARKPETCNACHIGPDHPQWEIYQESPHGISYMTRGYSWNWEAEPGTLTTVDFPAPTCATCHISGFGSAGTTHDVGDRLAWYLFAPVSERRPSWQDNLVRMQGVCLQCHNPNFITDFYEDGDAAVGRINELVEESNTILAEMQQAGTLTQESFDQPVDFVHFELWHHWGRTAKFGVWMQGPDYTQWHGAYEMLADLAELRSLAEEAQPDASTGGGQ